jgi:hypothetical protein
LDSISLIEPKGVNFISLVKLCRHTRLERVGRTSEFLRNSSDRNNTFAELFCNDWGETFEMISSAYETLSEGNPDIQNVIKSLCCIRRCIYSFQKSIGIRYYKLIIKLLKRNIYKLRLLKLRIEESIIDQ